MMAAAGALCVAASGRGDLVLLGCLLALAFAERRSSTAVLLAAAAVAVRWGTTSLDTVTGAATTLGPGIRVGPPQAAAAVGLAAVALLLAGLGAPLLPRLAAGATAGALAIGPVGAASAGTVVLGLLGVVLGMLLARALPRLSPEPSDRLRGAAPVAALAALLLAAIW
jgi:hypothetical protein